MRQHAEPMPQWLERYRSAADVDVRGFLGSRHVFYPGSGSDGHPLRVFGASGAAHCFVYVDYGMTRESLIEPIRMQAPAGVRGYALIGEHVLGPSDLVGGAWSLSKPLKDAHLERAAHWARVEPFATLCILERLHRCGDSHGPSRLAILFLGDDAISTYDILYGLQLRRGPFAMVLHDHGLGGNWDYFGVGGVMERVAHHWDIFPEWLLCNEGQDAWPGYEPPLIVRSCIGGMHRSPRRLWRRIVK